MSRGFLLTGEAETWARFDRAVERVHASLDAMHERHSARADVARIDEAARAYVTAAETAARRRTATGDPREVVPMLETSLSPARDRFEESISAMLDSEQNDFDHASHHARAFAHRTQQLVLLATGAGIGLSIAMAWLSIRTLRQHYERERAATASAQHSSDARDELLAIVSHDLRSPLSAIEMGACLLEERLEDPIARKQVAVVRNASDRMQRLIEQLLDKATIETGAIDLRNERCDVGQIVRTVEELFGARARAAGVRLALDLESGLLLALAVQHARPDGDVTVSARPSSEGARFAISETSPPMPAGERASSREPSGHYFDEYTMELHISKRLVEAHGGKLGVDGDALWLSLPNEPQLLRDPAFRADLNAAS